MLEDIIKEREKKRDNLKKAGYDVYPSTSKRDYRIGDAARRFLFLSLMQKTLTISGRIMGMRAQGGVMFLDLKDNSGKIQAVLNKKRSENFDILKENLDIGDFVSVTGSLFKTKKGEKSVNVETLTPLVKSLRPLPSGWHGLKDVEERYRKRYLDILINQRVQDSLINRSKIVRKLRESLEREDFLEVETPILQPIPGGATARPFKTHHNSLDADFYLRIAPELYLKRLLVGGLEKVFEIGKSFRNEGMDRDHNPEFTTLELYWAYQDYRGLIKFIEGVLKNIWREFKGGEWKWETTTFSDLIQKHTGKNWEEFGAEKLEEVYKKEIRLAGKIRKTTLVTDYPAMIMPLAKFKKDNEKLTESFQLIAGSEDTGAPGGPEIIKGFSEMNDPEKQRKQMEEQEQLFRSGNEEASRLDEDFLESLEYGMPPAAGLGIGIDRLTAILTGTHSIKEIIAFPTLKPKKEE